MKKISAMILIIFVVTGTGCGEKTAGDASVIQENASSLIKLSAEDRFLQLKKEAEDGDASANYHLAKIYQHSIGDIEAAENLYSRAANLGDPFAQAHVSYETILHSKNDDEVNSAIDKLAILSDKGNFLAQRYIGAFYSLSGSLYEKDLYKSGEFFNFDRNIIKNHRDIPKAVSFLLKSVAQGNSDSADILANIYEETELKNQEKSESWRKQAHMLREIAANKGDVEAQFYLGLFQHNEKMRIMAAEQGGAAGLRHAAYDSAIGIVTPLNVELAIVLYKRAADLGDPEAQYSLAGYYEKGDNIPKDEEKAFDYYLKSAAQGDVTSQFIVYLKYELGDGVGRDLVRAYAWLNIYLASYHEDTTGAKSEIKWKRSNRLDELHRRDDLAKKLTPNQLADAQKLSSIWIKGKNLVSVEIDDTKSYITRNGVPSIEKTGTAFFVSEDGDAITNHHVIEGCSEVKISGRDGVVKVISSDSVNDLALLRLNGKPSDIVSINSEPGKIRQGDDVIVFGYPLNSLLSSGGNLTFGTISALSGLKNNTNQIQITASIQPGSSGSPVMDNHGYVIGVVSMKLSETAMEKATGSISQNVNFAVNGSTIKTFLDTNKVSYQSGGWLSFRKNNADVAEKARKSTVLLECWK